MKALMWFLLMLFVTLQPAQQRDVTIRAQGANAYRSHVVQPGDTWLALTWRYQLAPAELDPYRSINRQRQPPIGVTLTVPDRGIERTGRLVRTDRGLLETAVRHDTSPWRIATESGLDDPYLPPAYQPLFIADGTAALRELPTGLDSLAVSQIPARPGQALGVRAKGRAGQNVRVALDMEPFAGFDNGRYYVSLGGTGAFFGSKRPELSIRVDDHPLWSQPWLFVESIWTFEDIVLTGSAAQIDQQSIREERERLFAIWSEATGIPAWDKPFRPPLDTFVALSSYYGARRSYNGGPYRSYHEGVDYAAYGGTPVYAAAAGRVAIAETLFVRGGAVIIDHGLGIYTGYYHMSNVLVAAGDEIQQGQLIGEVGSTGLSTGNHLHWDLLVNAVWIDANAWQEQEMGCWILEGLGEECH